MRLAAEYFKFLSEQNKIAEIWFQFCILLYFHSTCFKIECIHLERHNKDVQFFSIRYHFHIINQISVFHFNLLKILNCHYLLSSVFSQRKSFIIKNLTRNAISICHAHLYTMFCTQIIIQMHFLDTCQLTGLTRKKKSEIFFTMKQQNYQIWKHDITLSVFSCFLFLQCSSYKMFRLL